MSPRSDYPGEFEQMVMLVILRLDGEAYALSVLRALDADVGRRVSRGALYSTLDRLEEKGLVTWTQESTTPRRGGHPRRCFSVTDRGVDVLRRTQSALLHLWDGLEGVLGGTG